MFGKQRSEFPGQSRVLWRTVDTQLVDALVAVFFEIIQRVLGNITHGGRRRALHALDERSSVQVGSKRSFDFRKCFLSVVCDCLAFLGG